MRILVTGATGFVGSALMTRLAGTPDVRLRAAIRNPAQGGIPGVEYVPAPDLAAEANWIAALKGVDVVVHLAARVHVLRETSLDPLAAFRRVNVDGTLALARKAMETGVRRFLYMSSIKVNGELTLPGRPFTATDPPRPLDAYAVSKLEAETGLAQMAAEGAMQFVVIRPPLVYGPGVSANFRSMMTWLRRGVPLPLGAVHNKRSLVALDNLVDLVVTCLDHPAAANRTFLVSDGEDLSTTELLLRLGRELQRPARLIPVPIAMLKAGAVVLGARDVAVRLCDSLQVDIASTCERLGWHPPVSVAQGLRRVAGHFIGAGSG